MHSLKDTTNIIKIGEFESQKDVDVCIYDLPSRRENLVRWFHPEGKTSEVLYRSLHFPGSNKDSSQTAVIT